MAAQCSTQGAAQQAVDGEPTRHLHIVRTPLRGRTSYITKLAQWDVGGEKAW